MNKLKVVLMMAGLIVLIFLLSLKNELNKKETQIEEPPVVAEEKPEIISDQIRVVLKTNDGSGIYHEAVTLVPDSAYEVICDSKSMVYEAGEEFTLSKDGGEGLFRENQKFLVIPMSETSKTLIPTISRSQGTPVYRGAFELQCDENGIVIINDLSVEEYLYAVVPSEMPSDYPAEALKAQAICARTYALKQMQHSKYTDIGAHVDDSTSFQVYNYIGECDAVNDAVDATRGKVVTYDGEVKDTY